MEGKDFRDSIKIVESPEKKIREKLTEQYKFLTGEESINFTKKMIMNLGDVVESFYPGVGFMIIGRVKAEDSHQGKINKTISNKIKENKNIYDTIGVRLVIETIPDSITDYMDEKIDAEDIAVINKFQTLISEAKNKLDAELLEINKKMDKVKENDEVVQIIQEMREKIIALYDEKIKMYNEEIKRRFSQYVLKKVLNSDKIKKELGIARIPGRSKIKLGGKTGYYYAAHDSIKASIPYKGEEREWVGEVQSMSLEDYTSSIEGPGAHENCEGKDRRFPQIRGMEKDNGEFKEKVLKGTPQMLIYSEGKLIVCSEMANITHHYLSILQKFPQLLELIQDKNGVFSDESEVIDKSELSHGEL